MNKERIKQKIDEILKREELLDEKGFVMLKEFIETTNCEELIQYHMSLNSEAYYNYRNDAIALLWQRKLYAKILWHVIMRRFPGAILIHKLIKGDGCRPKEYFKGLPMEFDFHEIVKHNTSYLRDLYENLCEYEWTYNLELDAKSRRVLLGCLWARVTMHQRFYDKVNDSATIAQYFDPAIITCDKDEVFVDCGGYSGDTVQSYIDKIGSYNKMFIYEPEDRHFEALLNIQKRYNSIYVRKKGVSNENKIVYFNCQGAGSSRISEGVTEDKIEVTRLDFDLREEIPTFIKMDIEGEEKNALEGSRAIIEKLSPKLAICAYHKADDIWKIPKQILSMNKNYKFYFRHYTTISSETVLYAIPILDHE